MIFSNETLKLKGSDFLPPIPEELLVLVGVVPDVSPGELGASGVADPHVVAGVRQQER